MVRKVEGTDKFIIYLYNGKNVRGKQTAKPKHFVYDQWGKIVKIDENNKNVGSIFFSDYGQMLHFINKIMRKKVMKNLKEKRTWS